jgi:hypothetical protein
MKFATCCEKKTPVPGQFITLYWDILVSKPRIVSQQWIALHRYCSQSQSWSLPSKECLGIWEGRKTHPSQMPRQSPVRTKQTLIWMFTQIFSKKMIDWKMNYLGTCEEKKNVYWKTRV